MFFVEETIRQLLGEFNAIPDNRKVILRNLAEFCKSNQPARLIFICTHNSRRSHIAQIWATTAASFFNAPQTTAYSGGTEATAFNPRAVSAMRNLGFKIKQTSAGENPRYLIQFASDHPSFEVYSKKYDEPENPASGFAAIMTCTHADENCPMVVGATTRISLPFDDPKDFDGTALEAVKYRERALEIGREILYAFSLIKQP